MVQFTQRVIVVVTEEEKVMEYDIRKLRESTGMNRKEFCEYFNIPYRTVTEWELGGRHAPEYVIRLLEYYIRMEKILPKKAERVSDREGL